MSKFNRSGAAAVAVAPAGPIRTTGPATTFEGGPGFARDARSDLFLLAVTHMVGEDTFYESAGARDARFEGLVRQVAVQDPDWMARFIPWLRSGANMRSASIVAACDAVKARLDAGSGASDNLGDHMTVGYQTRDMTAGGHNRAMINAACQRADEPGEVLAYWTSRYGRAIPKPVKRGVADAVARLYTEYSLAKYDGDSRGFRFADVIDLVHPAADPAKPWQGDLFRYALDRRHDRGNPVPESLQMLWARAELLALPVAERRGVLLADDGPRRLADAGLTWEALAGWLQGPMDAAAWSAIIPAMGVMALARNLRNFDEAGVPDDVAAAVAARFADPVQVARSRMFPYRWLQAYLAAPSLRWGHALEKALTVSTAAIPDLPGRTLVLVDTSDSMRGGVSGKSTIRHVDIGALIGVALAYRGCQVDLVGFADGVFRHPVTAGGSMLRDIAAFTQRIGEVGHGTRIMESVQATFNGHDRVVVVSDMQTFPQGNAGYSYGRPYYDVMGRVQRNQVRHQTVSDMVPANVPLFGINTTGYATAVVDSSRPNRFEVGGFSDKVFTMFAALSTGDGSWPF